MLNLDVGKSSVSTAHFLGVRTTLRAQIETEQVLSSESLRLHMMMALPSKFCVGKGQESSANLLLALMKHCHNCFTSPLLHTFAVRASWLQAFNIACAIHPICVGLVV